jgi:hypothetical protein
MARGGPKDELRKVRGIGAVTANKPRTGELHLRGSSVRTFLGAPQLDFGPGLSMKSTPVSPIRSRLATAEHRVCGTAFQAALVAVLLALVGCSSARTAQVSGIVTYRGKPVPDAVVTFVARGAPAAFGGTDAEGRYALTVSCPDSAATGDRHTVMVTPAIRISADGITPDPATPLVRPDIPGRYHAAESTPLSAEIVAGRANVVDLTLEDG